MALLPASEIPPSPREPSPAPSQQTPRKRKHLTSTTPSQTNCPSPAPDGAAPLQPLHNLSNRPRLTISRVPTFVPVSEGSEYYNTEQLPYNHRGFRYTPAGVSPPGSVLPCTTIESAPTSFRVGWEDRSPFITVTKDGLGLTGNKGFRSARCNVPVREGKWYMEVKVLCGGGDSPPEGSKASARGFCHVRLGWGRREAPLNGPVGLDGYSYGFRDRTGEKVTLSRPRPYGRPFGTGDVIGMYISLPPRITANAKNDANDPVRIKRERIPIEFKGQEYFESLEYPQSKEMIALMDPTSNISDSTTSIPHNSPNKKSATVKNLPERGPRPAKSVKAPAALRPLPTLEDSRIAFFINGEPQGIAFSDIYSYLQLRVTPASRKSGGGGRRNNRSAGASEFFSNKHKENPFDDGTLGYYAFISLYNDARVRMNPGPDFEYPPPADIDALLTGSEPRSTERTWRPIVDRYPEFMAEQWALDVEEEAAAKVATAAKLAQDQMDAAKQDQKDKRRVQAAEARKRAKKTHVTNVATAAAIAAATTASGTVSANENALALDSVSTPTSMRLSPAAAAILDTLRQESLTPAPSSPFPTHLEGRASAGLRLSPTPTAVSSMDLHGTAPASVYGSEGGDVDIEGEPEGDGDAETGERPEGSVAILVGYPDQSASITYKPRPRTPDGEWTNA